MLQTTLVSGEAVSSPLELIGSLHITNHRGRLRRNNEGCTHKIDLKLIIHEKRPSICINTNKNIPTQDYSLCRSYVEIVIYDLQGLQDCYISSHTIRIGHLHSIIIHPFLIIQVLRKVNSIG